MLTEAQIRIALRDVYDPELPLNLLDLGVLVTVRLRPDHDAPGAGIAGVPERSALTVELLDRGETIAPALAALAYNRLAGLPALSHIQVLTLAEPWTPARITPNGRRLLKLPDPNFPILK